MLASAKGYRASPSLADSYYNLVCVPRFEPKAAVALTAAPSASQPSARAVRHRPAWTARASPGIPSQRPRPRARRPALARPPRAARARRGRAPRAGGDGGAAVSARFARTPARRPRGVRAAAACGARSRPWRLCPARARAAFSAHPRQPAHHASLVGGGSGGSRRLRSSARSRSSLPVRVLKEAA